MVINKHCVVQHLRGTIVACSKVQGSTTAMKGGNEDLRKMKWIVFILNYKQKIC